MAPLPRPTEPTTLILKEYAGNDKIGKRDFLIDGTPLPKEPVTKQGMIGYLWHHWKSANISYDDIQKATGRLDMAIRLWMQNDYDWNDLLDRYGEILERKIE